ncbi:hypothetical protein [Streptomyces niveus]|uniref:hypothetical protein n=1 Tax=Streptomyces niveus TaxID=193462 RepID=UPI0036D2F827
MTLIDAVFAYVRAVDAVVATAHVWAPLLLGLAGLAWGAYPPVVLRDTRPDTSGYDADDWADTDPEEST